MADKLAYHAKDMIENGRDFMVAKVVDTSGSTPRKKGAVMIMADDESFFGTVGGGRIEAVTQEKCRENFKNKTSREIYHYKLNTTEKDALDMGCGGAADVLVEYIQAGDPGDFMDEFNLNSRAFIFGGGHVGLALEPVLRHIDFATTVIDDRAEYASRERFPGSRVVVVPSFAESFKSLQCDENTYIVIVTRGHMGDLDVLREALKQPCAYIGMIGSRNKNKLLYAKLKEEGVTQEQLDRIYAPIGENIYAETPEEIGISIAAEMIRVRTGHGTR